MAETIEVMVTKGSKAGEGAAIATGYTAKILVTYLHIIS